MNNLQQQLSALGNKAAGAVNGLYGSWKDAAMKTGVPQGIGDVVGAAGAGIGGVVGGLGNFFDRSLHGQGFDPQSMGQDIYNTAASTGQAGQRMGEAGAVQAPLQYAGAIGRGAMAIPPAMSALNDVQSGKMGLGTGLNAGAAAMGMYGAMTDPTMTPGGVFDKQLGALGMPGSGSMQNVSNGSPDTSSNEIDPNTNYGENLMNNDGGAQDSKQVGQPANQSVEDLQKQYHAAWEIKDQAAMDKIGHQILKIQMGDSPMLPPNAGQ